LDTSIDGAGSLARKSAADIARPVVYATAGKVDICCQDEDFDAH
jgi:hypothetical protein